MTTDPKDFAQCGQQIIAVMDLSAGRAVHAVAGNRRLYQPIRINDGDPIALLEYYHLLGLDRFYLADLDALQGGSIQSDVIIRVIDALAQKHSKQLVLDIGWRHTPEQTQSVTEIHRHAETSNSPGLQVAGLQVAGLQVAGLQIDWVAATETMESFDDVRRLVSLVGPSRVVLSLDFRGGVLISETGTISPDTNQLTPWCHQAIKEQLEQVIVLDVAAVGTGTGFISGAICKQVRSLIPNVTLYSGGGISKPSDLQALWDCGCDRALVASALLPKCHRQK